MSVREPTESGLGGRPPDVESLAREVRARLSGDRLRHVEAVVSTAREVARTGGWPDATARAAERAAWSHDAVKEEGPAAWRRRIEAAGEIPDPWSVEHGIVLLHAQAAAVWARSMGERDPAVLAAVRHHPTAHPEWGDVGRILYVSDFCEPTRSFSEAVGAADLRERSARGSAGLTGVAREVLRIRLTWMLERGGPVHPDSWRAWNAWSVEERP